MLLGLARPMLGTDFVSVRPLPPKTYSIHQRQHTPVQPSSSVVQQFFAAFNPLSPTSPKPIVKPRPINQRQRKKRPLPFQIQQPVSQVQSVNQSPSPNNTQPDSSTPPPNIQPTHQQPLSPPADEVKNYDSFIEPDPEDDEDDIQQVTGESLEVKNNEFFTNSDSSDFNMDDMFNQLSISNQQTTPPIQSVDPAKLYELTKLLSEKVSNNESEFVNQVIKYMLDKQTLVMELQARISLVEEKYGSKVNVKKLYNDYTRTANAVFERYAPGDNSKATNFWLNVNNTQDITDIFHNYLIEGSLYNGLRNGLSIWARFEWEKSEQLKLGRKAIDSNGLNQTERINAVNSIKDLIKTNISNEHDRTLAYMELGDILPHSEWIQSSTEASGHSTMTPEERFDLLVQGFTHPQRHLPPKDDIYTPPVVQFSQAIDQGKSSKRRSNPASLSSPPFFAGAQSNDTSINFNVKTQVSSPVTEMFEKMMSFKVIPDEETQIEIESLDEDSI